MVAAVAATVVLVVAELGCVVLTGLLEILIIVEFHRYVYNMRMDLPIVVNRHIGLLCGIVITIEACRTVVMILQELDFNYNPSFLMCIAQQALIINFPLLQISSLSDKCMSVTMYNNPLGLQSMSSKTVKSLTET